MSNGAEPKALAATTQKNINLAIPTGGGSGRLNVHRLSDAPRYRYPKESKWMIETSTAETLRRDLHNAAGNTASVSMSIFDTALNGGT
jgi:hypothetical protein